MTNKDFINILGELAKSDMKKTGVLASLTIAQGVLESGWGKSKLATEANNLFGIKATAGWTGKVYSAKTKECYDGVDFVTTTALFKAYSSSVGCIEDHSALFLYNPRYANLIGETDYKTACQAVKDAGYATDPDYVTKLIALIEDYKLYEYDISVSEKEQKEHWAVPFESVLLERGLITTRKDLDGLPTRGEMSVIVCKILELIDGGKKEGLHEN